MADHDELTGSLAQIRTRLLSEFAESLSTDAVDAAIAEQAAQFASARVTTFVPMLVERACREQLRKQLVHS
jgi:hypothetical protein